VPKKPKNQKRYPHKLAENYPSNSLYNWELFSDKKLKIRKEAAKQIIEDHIILYDMFWATNDFVNHLNDDKDNIFKVEEKLNGLSKLFVLGMIDDLDHQDNLTNTANDIIETTRGSSMSIKDRAEMVEMSLRQRILHL